MSFRQYCIYPNLKGNIARNTAANTYCIYVYCFEQFLSKNQTYQFNFHIFIKCQIRQQK